MKRREIIKRLEEAGWYLKRRGGNHDIYWNDKARRPVPVKHQREISDEEARQIFKEAGL